MKYLLLFHPGDTDVRLAAMSEEARRATLAEFVTASQAEGVSAAYQLHPADTATTVRVAEGRTLITDGPFAEAKEAVGGFMLLEAPNLDAAIALAARIPTARLGGAVEIRPVMER